MMPMLWIVGILMLGWIAYIVYCAHDDHIQCDQRFFHYFVNP